MTLNLRAAPPPPPPAPPIPSRIDDAQPDFDNKTDAYLNWLEAFREWLDGAHDWLADFPDWGDELRRSMLAAQAAAQKAQWAAEQVAGAQPWRPGAAYAVDDAVWSGTGGDRLFRCRVAVNGSTTPPEDDPAHWSFTGASTEVDPTSGPTRVTLQRDAAGRISGAAFTQSGRDGAIALTRNNDGRITQASTTYEGRTRIETPRYDADGALIGVTAAVV
jgi:hypothetical protein